MSRMDGFAENLTDVVRERYEFGCKFIAGFFRGGGGGEDYDPVFTGVN